MALRWLLQRNAYHDSVKLMRVSEMLNSESGIVRAAAVMATPLNIELLARDGLLPPEVEAVPEDLLVSVLAEDDAAGDRALARLQDLLRPREMPAGERSEIPARTIEAAAAHGGGNLAVIAVPGPHAAAEAFAALRAGLHVFLFSDNVPLVHEIALKRLAAERELLMMGPDCGTAVIGGLGLGFANRMPPGPVGIVGASGTGIQQLCSLLDTAGVGLAQAIGTGGRDLSSTVGGSMTRRGLAMLDGDDAVEVIAVISKPADEGTARALDAELRAVSKPVVACLLGQQLADTANLRYTRTLTDAARSIVEGLGRRWTDPDAGRTVSPAGSGGAVYGLFAGGTLCSEAAQTLDEMGVPHRLTDLGADEYTSGRAHPIIDPRLRASMLADLAGRDDAGAVLLDIILGDLAHPDPAGALLPAIEAIRPIPTVAVLVGTRDDPQGLEEQRAMLEGAGVCVLAGNVAAARAAGAAAGSAA